MAVPLKVLLVEDRPEDAKLILHELQQAGYRPAAQRVDNEADFRAALEPSLDVILADYGLPGWRGSEALAVVQRSGFDIPLILVSGTIPDEGAVEIIKQGAADYLLKDRLARLGVAVDRALTERRLRRERRAGEEALRRAEANYRGIFENAHEGIVQTATDGTILTANPAMARIFGYDSPGQFQREAVSMARCYAEPADRDTVMRQLRDSGRILNHEIRFRRHDGRLIWASVSIQVVKDESGAEHFEGSVQDVTERKQAVEALRESERRFVRQRNTLISLTGADNGRRGDLTARFRQITEGSARTLEVARVSLWLFNEARTAIRCADLYELAADRHSAGMELSAAGFPAYFQALAGMDVLAVEDPRRDPRTSEFTGGYLDPLGITAMLDAGVRVHGRVEGVLCHEQTDRPRAWQTDEQTFAAALANLASLALMEGQRRTAAEALQQSETRFRNLTENTSDWIWETDGRGVYTYSSPRVHDLLGYEPGEVLGRTPFDLMPAAEAARLRPVFAARVELRQPLVSLENINLHKDGRQVVLETNAVPVFDAEGAWRGYRGIDRDITERLRMEQTLREEQALFTSLITTIPDHIYFKDRQSRFIRINGALARRFGLGHPDEAVGRTDADMFSGAHARQSHDDEQRIMETGEPMLGVEERETWPDGRVTWASTTKVPLRDAGGRITGLVGISRDITEKKLLEEKFLHAQRLESLGMLAAGIAHDLNNVLSPIMFASPVLRQNLTSERDLKILDTIAQSAARGAGLVKQILSFARSTAGEALIIQVKHIVRDIVGVIEETFPKAIRLEQDIPSDLWSVTANATQIHQVLMNLCVNARDAMPEGGTLRLIAANRRLNGAEAAVLAGARPGNWIMLEVTDTGTGIPPAVLEHIWEPFYTTKAPGTGTGLGLSTVRGIVTNHLGFIELTTAPGVGTTFRIYLPASEADAAGTCTAPPMEVKTGHNELILVVDDEEPIRDIVASILGSFGYRFLCCRDGAEALTVFNAHAGEIPLVITDLDMPELGGLALAAALQKLQPEIKIIAMSGLAQHAAHDMAATDIGKAVHAFLLKPFKPEELLNAMHVVLHPIQQGQPQRPIAR